MASLQVGDSLLETSCGWVPPTDSRSNWMMTNDTETCRLLIGWTHDYAESLTRAMIWFSDDVCRHTGGTQLVAEKSFVFSSSGERSVNLTCQLKHCNAVCYIDVVVEDKLEGLYRLQDNPQWLYFINGKYLIFWPNILWYSRLSYNINHQIWWKQVFSHTADRTPMPYLIQPLKYTWGRNNRSFSNIIPARFLKLIHIKWSNCCFSLLFVCVKPVVSGLFCRVSGAI